MDLLEECKTQMDFMEHMDKVLEGLTELAMRQDGKFHYPKDKRRTKQTTEAMRTAEKNLDDFWGTFKRTGKKFLVNF